MNNMGDMFGKLQEMQQGMQQAKERLNDITVESEVGGGMLKVTANANKRVIKVTIDPEVLKDQEMLEDLICAGVNKAMEQAEEAAREEIGKVTSGFIPNIPGLDLKQFGL